MKIKCDTCKLQLKAWRDDLTACACAESGTAWKRNRKTQRVLNDCPIYEAK